jgi:uncharacterized protein (TIGR00159 family)
MWHFLDQYTTGFAQARSFDYYLVLTLDILIVYYLIYRILLLIKGTRAAQMLFGIMLILVGFFAAKRLELTTVSWLLDNFINYFIIIIIVVFQTDIRRGLMRIGKTPFLGGSRVVEETHVFEEVIKAAEMMARKRIGGLIVLERDADLSEFIESGVNVDAAVTKELLYSIFIPELENPIHDGAVVIKNLRLSQAGAVLPLSSNPRLEKSLGTRHRAAIGITEETDAVVVVVSEEKGIISLCFTGNIARDLDAATLRKALLGLFHKKKTSGKYGRRKGDMPAPTIAQVTEDTPPPVGAAPAVASAVGTTAVAAQAAAGAGGHDGSPSAAD